MIIDNFTQQEYTYFVMLQFPTQILFIFSLFLNMLQLICN